MNVPFDNESIQMKVYVLLNVDWVVDNRIHKP